MEERLNNWPSGVKQDDFSKYMPRRMKYMDLWVEDEWAIKAYAIQSDNSQLEGDRIVGKKLWEAARNHVLRVLPLTNEEGSFYKTGFAILHEGAQANWLLFQWWTHDDVWCQLLAYADHTNPLHFKHSTRPVRACVYETAIIWFEQKSWIKNVLCTIPSRSAYLNDYMQDDYC